MFIKCGSLIIRVIESVKAVLFHRRHLHLFVPIFQHVEKECSQKHIVWSKTCTLSIFFNNFYICHGESNA